MEIRHLRYFLTLAETLHFGRAAEREFITQSAFSQHVARLERELGVALFERRSNRVRLTAAGEAFVPRAQRLLDQLREAETEAREIAGGAAGVLRIGVFGEGAGELTPLILGTFRSAFPNVALRFVELTMTTQVEALAGGAVDVAILRPPIPDARLELDVLFAEPRYAVVSERHGLADAESVSVADLIDEPFAAASAPAPRSWSSFWCCDDDRGEPSRTAANVGSIAESLAAVAFLGAVDTFPGAAVRRFPHPGVAFVPMRDGAYATVAVAQRTGDERPLVRSFRSVALRTAREQLDVVPLAVPADQAPPGTPVPA